MPLNFRNAFASRPVDDPGHRQSEAHGERNGNGAGHPADGSGDESVRRGCPRAIAGSALAALKELGPRLTPAQRTSIDILEKYDRLRSTARYNQDLFALPAASDSDSDSDSDFDYDTDAALSRPASFLLIGPTLAQLDASLREWSEEMHAPLPLAARTIRTAQTAVAHELIETVKQRALDSARGGFRLRPLTLDTEHFQRFLHDNEDGLRAFIASCDHPYSRTAQQHCLEHLATRYLAERDIAFSGLRADLCVEGVDIPAGAPLTVNLQTGTEAPVHLIVNDDEGDTCLILLAGSRIEESAFNPHDPDNMTFGMTEDFTGCAQHEREAVIYLQHLFHVLADIEQQVALKAGMRIDMDQDLGRPLIRTAHEKTYTGSTLLGDECELTPPPDQNQRGQLVRGLTRLRKMATLRAADHPEPLLTIPALDAWVRSVDFINDCEMLRTPAKRLEHAQRDAVAAALRASGVFGDLPARR